MQLKQTKKYRYYQEDLIKNPSNSYICSRVRNIRLWSYAVVEVVLVYKKDVDLCKDQLLFVSLTKPLYSPYDFITVRIVFFKSYDPESLVLGESNIDYEAIYFLRKSGVGISGPLYRLINKKVK